MTVFALIISPFAETLEFRRAAVVCYLSASICQMLCGYLRGSRGSSKPRFVSKRIYFLGNVNCLSNFRGFTPVGRIENANTCEVPVVLLEHNYSRVNNVHVHTKA